MSSIRIPKDVNDKKKRSLIVLGIISCVCLVLCLIGSVMGDKTPPKLDFTYAVASVNYSETNPLTATSFLNGVTAVDSKDGDLTSDIYVSSMDFGAEGKTLTISYGVKDYNGNVTTAKRVYNLNGSIATIFEAKPETEAETTELQTLRETSEAESESTEETPEETTVESTEEESTEVATTEYVEETTEFVEPTTEEIVATEETLPEPTTEEITEPDVEFTESVATGEAPVLTLTVSEVTYPAGSPRVNFRDFIDELYDDVDDYFVLSYEIWAENEDAVDFDIPGDYTVIYHVKDSDGNWNEPVSLIVHIV